MPRNWYDFKAQADGTTSISIFDEIGGWGVTAKDFIASLSAATGNAIDLSINSPGGSVFDAFAIYNALKNSGKSVTVTVMGIAASAASLVAMAGNKIVMPENSFMMVHSPLNGIYGNAADMREMADVLDKIESSLVSTYVARTGQSDAAVRDMLAKDTYMTAAECLALGFADEVTSPVTATARFEREHLPAHIQALFKADSTGGVDGAVDDTDDAATGGADAGQVDEPAITFAEQVQAAASKAGVGEYAANLALDATLTDIAQVQARIAEVREIRALCELAKRPEDTKTFVAQGKTLADARIALSEVMAAASEQTHTDSVPTSSNKPTVGVQSSAVKTADIWAARHNSRSKP